MKSQLISALALTALLFAGSCAQDDLRNPAQGPGNVNFQSNSTPTPRRPVVFSATAFPPIIWLTPSMTPKPGTW